MNRTFVSRMAPSNPVQELPLTHMADFSHREKKTENFLSENSHITAKVLTGNAYINDGGVISKPKKNVLQEIFTLGFKNNLSPGIQWWNVKSNENDVTGCDKSELLDADVTGNRDINNIMDYKRSVDKNRLQVVLDNCDNTFDSFPTVKKEKQKFSDCQNQTEVTLAKKREELDLKSQKINSEFYYPLFEMKKNEGPDDIDKLSSKQDIFQPILEETLDMKDVSDTDLQDDLPTFEMFNDKDISPLAQETNFSTNESSISSPSSLRNEIWDMEDSMAYESMNFSSFVDELDNYFVEREQSLDQRETPPNDEAIAGGITIEETGRSLGDSSIEITPENFLSDINGTEKGMSEYNLAQNAENLAQNTENLAQSIPQIDLNTKGIQLLVEALQTQSFLPIVHLLLSALNNNSLNNIVDNNKSNETDSDVSSPRTSQHELSSQSSFDSDQFSDCAEFSPSSTDSNNNEINSNYEQTYPNLDLFQSLQNILENNESAFANLGGERQNGMKRPAVDKIPVTGNKIPRIEHSTGSLQANPEIDNIIENFICSTEKCDLQTFENILDRETDSAKTFKNASTETTRTRGNRDPIFFDSTSKQNNEWRKGVYVVKRNYERNNIEKDQQVEKRGRKRGNKHPTLRPGPNKCYHLWDFLRELLESSSNNKAFADVIQWSNKEREEFKLIDTKRLAELWGMKKRLTKMNYDKLSRSLRYYIKLDILRKVPGKRLHFQFGNGRMWRKIEKQDT